MFDLQLDTVGLAVAGPARGDDKKGLAKRAALLLDPAADLDAFIDFADFVQAVEKDEGVAFDEPGIDVVFGQRARSGLFAFGEVSGEGLVGIDVAQR